MAAHKHEWELLHEIWFDESLPEGEVGHEHTKPYRTEFCVCGQKRTVELTDAEAQALGLRIGKIIHDELTNVGSSGQAG